MTLFHRFSFPSTSSVKHCTGCNKFRDLRQHFLSPYVERSYLPARRSPADVVAHRVSGCTAVVKGALERCPEVRANAIRLGWLPGSACSFAMFDHPLQVPLPA